jgi:uncharacterized Zn finger protein
VITNIDPSNLKLDIYYRCNRCLSVLHEHLNEAAKANYIVPCSKCTGFAVKIPSSVGAENIFKNKPFPPQAAGY